MRDFIHIEDCVKGVISTMDKIDDGSGSCWGATKEFGVTMRAEAKF